MCLGHPGVGHGLLSIWDFWYMVVPYWATWAAVSFSDDTTDIVLLSVSVLSSD